MSAPPILHTYAQQAWPVKHGACTAKQGSLSGLPCCLRPACAGPHVLILFWCCICRLPSLASDLSLRSWPGFSPMRRPSPMDL